MLVFDGLFVSSDIYWLKRKSSVKLMCSSSTSTMHHFQWYVSIGKKDMIGGSEVTLNTYGENINAEFLNSIPFFCEH